MSQRVEYVFNHAYCEQNRDLTRLWLEKSKGKGGGDTDTTAAAYKEKMVAMNKNFSSLQTEYDQATRDVSIRLVQDDLSKRKQHATCGFIFSNRRSWSHSTP